MTRQSMALSLCLLIGLGLSSGCRTGNRGAERLAEDSSSAEELDSNLTFSNITLEQADTNGQTLWKVKAEEATYSPDQKSATVRNPDGELYQDGEAIYHIEAATGEVKQDANRIILRGSVVATDLQSGAILRGDELEWVPQRDLLIVRGNLQGTHPKVQIKANEARASNRKREVTLTGNIEAVTLESPTVKLVGEQVIWRVDQDMVISNQRIRVQQIQNGQVTDQAEGDRAEFNLETRIAKLLQNAMIVFQDPPLNVMGNSLVWNATDQTVVADQPVTVVHRQEQITLTANQGRMELKPKIAYFNDNVRATGQQDQSQLTSDRLTWNITSQQVNAEGNVVYVQPDPPATLRGPRAVGRLQDRTVVVSGGRVETQIVPQGEFAPGG